MLFVVMVLEIVLFCYSCYLILAIIVMVLELKSCYFCSWCASWLFATLVNLRRHAIYAILPF